MDGNSPQASRAGGVSFFALLAILFIGLKLTGNIDWSWWWVLAPLWMPAVFGLLVVLGGLAVMVITFGRLGR